MSFHHTEMDKRRVRYVRTFFRGLRVVFVVFVMSAFVLSPTASVFANEGQATTTPHHTDDTSDTINTDQGYQSKTSELNPGSEAADQTTHNTSAPADVTATTIDDAPTRTNQATQSQSIGIASTSTVPTSDANSEKDATTTAPLIDQSIDPDSDSGIDSTTSEESDDVASLHSEDGDTSVGIPSATTTEETSSSTDHYQAGTSLATTTDIANEDQVATSSSSTNSSAPEVATSTATTTAGTPQPEETELPPTHAETEAESASSTDVKTSSPIDSTEKSDTASSTATTTDVANETLTGSIMPEESAPVPLLAQTVNNDNRYQFGKNECTILADGAYYCFADATKQEHEETKVPIQHGVIALPDTAEGDSEIYVFIDGTKHQITDNVYEDRAPYFDAKSNRIVWSRLINDRYQVVSYDMETGALSYLTNTTYNNMEPSAYGDITVWQAWIDGNWEIMTYERDTSATTSVQRLTTNHQPEIAPYINQKYIIWKTKSGDRWYATLYDRTTETIRTIKQENGDALTNPRLMVVFDSHDGNGDVTTLGYNVETKKVVPLVATPVSVPAEVPSPTPQKEKRAVIQSKPPAGREDIEDNSDDVPSGDPPKGPSNSNETTASSTPTNASSTIVIPPQEADVDVATNTPTSATSSALGDHTTTTYDIDMTLPPMGEAGTSTPTTTPRLPTDIPDVVIQSTVSSTNS